MNHQLPIHEYILPQQVPHPLFEERQIKVFVLRLDLLHPIVSGNKWLKLKGWIEEGRSEKRNGLLTMGGAWSNHVHATAGWCHANQLPFTAVIKANENFQTAMLQDVKNWGGKIIFTHRQMFYDHRHWLNLAQAEDKLFVPMGGDGTAGEKGVKEFFDQYLHQYFDEVWCAVGTATTIAGIAASRLPFKTLVAFNPGINDKQLDQKLEGISLSFPERNLKIRRTNNGRFGKTSPVLLQHMNEWYKTTGIPLDIAYTGKMMTEWMNEIMSDDSIKNKTFLLIHTGGLQGNRSVQEGGLKFSA